MTSALSRLEPPFVRSDDGLVRAVFVTAPGDTLDRIVPVQGEPHAIPDRAREQQAIFAARLRWYGIATHEVPADASALSCLRGENAVMFADGAFLMRPGEPGRRGETAVLEAALVAAGVPVVGRIEAPGLLDGGDVLIAGDTLYLGVAERRAAAVGVASFVHGNPHGRAQLAAYARTLGLKVVEVTYASTVRRLRAVATVVASDTVLVAASQVDAAAFGSLSTIVAPAGEDAGAGVLSLGGRRLIANLRFRTIIPLLRKAKFHVDAFDLWEFGKLGVAPSALALVAKRS